MGIYERTWHRKRRGPEFPEPGFRVILATVCLAGLGIWLYGRVIDSQNERPNANPARLPTPNVSSEAPMQPPTNTGSVGDAADDLTRVFHGWIAQHNLSSEGKSIHLRASSCVRSNSLRLGNDIFALFGNFPLEWQFTQIEPTIYQDRVSEADRLNGIQYRLAMTVRTGAWRVRVVEMAESGEGSGRIGDWSPWQDDTDFFATLGGIVIPGLPLRQTDQGYMVTFVKYDRQPNWFTTDATEARRFPTEFFSQISENNRPGCTEIFVRR